MNSIWKIKFLSVASVVLVGAMSWAFGWGAYLTADTSWWPDYSVKESYTHQAIDKYAWAFVAQDPAFGGIYFPSQADILANEGAYAMGKKGNGPDKEGASDYSWHYYNPSTVEGGAPAKIEEL